MAATMGSLRLWPLGLLGVAACESPITMTADRDRCGAGERVELAFGEPLPLGAEHRLAVTTEEGTTVAEHALPPRATRFAVACPEPGRYVVSIRSVAGERVTTHSPLPVDVTPPLEAIGNTP